jgi:hypothetical protein
MLYSGRRPGIKDGIGFQKGDNVKLNAPSKKLSNFVKGKAPMPQDSIIFLTLTRLVVVINFVNFSFALFTPPPLGDFQTPSTKMRLQNLL